MWRLYLLLVWRLLLSSVRSMNLFSIPVQPRSVRLSYHVGLTDTACPQINNDFTWWGNRIDGHKPSHLKKEQDSFSETYFFSYIWNTRRRKKSKYEWFQIWYSLAEPCTIKVLPFFRTPNYFWVGQKILSSSVIKILLPRLLQFVSFFT